MIRKVLITVAIIMSLISFYVLVGKTGVPIKVWLFVSLGPYMLIAALAMKFKSSLLQTILIPFLLFYGIGTVLNLPWKAQYAYAHISAILMLIMVVYFVVRHIIRLKFIKIALGIFIGVILFFALKYYQKNYISSKDLKKIPSLENRLLY